MESCEHFQRAIRGDCKELLDSLMEKAARHREPVIPDMALSEQIFLSIMLEHEKEILELRIRSTGVSLEKRKRAGEEER